MITKEQFKKLKKGDVIISPGGRERTVIGGGLSCVRLTSTQTHDGQTVYTYSDIYKKYKIKSMDTNQINEILEAAGMKKKDQYVVSYACNNCGHSGIMAIKKGVKIESQPCKNCGCKTIRNQ